MSQKKSRKKSKKTSKNFPNRKLISIFLLIFLVASLVTIASYFIIKKDSIENITTHQTTENLNSQKSNTELEHKELSHNESFEEKFQINEKHKFEEYTNELEKVIIEKADTEETINKENAVVQKKVEEIKEEKLKEKYKEQPKNKIDEKSIITQKDTFTYDKKNKPKIAIVIDDVTTQEQKEKILSMGYKINMAFLPPISGHPNSAKIAMNLPFYMIHFPMQASSAFKNEEPYTLKITDSYETIEKRVKQLRDWYPNAIYTNNHTGSVFTEDDESMDKLFRALKRHNFIFVDSRTSNKSVAKKYAKKYEMPYIVRNTFIDNEQKYQYIQNQLKQAIDIAKKNGYSIAIGHPHNVTLQVLKDSKHLLKDVEPIFINQLPYL